MATIYYKKTNGVLYLRNNNISGYSSYTTSPGFVSPPPWINSSDVTSVVIENVIKPDFLYDFFSGLIILQEIQNISNIDTSNATSMFNMFNKCNALESLDVSNFNTSKVTDMHSMFNNCNALTSLDVSHFNTSKVTDMSYMFNQCNALTSLDVSGFNTSKVTNMSAMFSQCNALTSLDVSNFDTSNVIIMSYMFNKCNALTSLDVSHFNTSNVKNMRSMFSECNALESLDVSGFNTSNVTDMAFMFNQCNALTFLDVSGFNTSNVTNMRVMFQSCNALESIEFFKYNIVANPNIANINSYYEYDSETETYFLTEDQTIEEKTYYTKNSNFNTSKVTDMSYMFNQCNALESLDVSGFDTSNVTSMRTMFQCCYVLESLDVSGFDTSNVTDMLAMFNQCRILTFLDVSDFNTSNVTDMRWMFSECYALESLDVSNFNTSKVTDMHSMFNNCNALESLDVSGFNTSNVTDMGWMFAKCYILESLDISNFNTSKVTDMCGMFNLCRALTSLDLSNFDTSKVTDMSNMFYNCSSLTSLDLSKFNTSNVIDMIDAFKGCKSFSNVLTINTNTTNYTGMFDDTTPAIIPIAGTSSRLQEIAEQWDNVYVYFPLNISLKQAERVDDYPTNAFVQVALSRFYVEHSAIEKFEVTVDNSLANSIEWYKYIPPQSTEYSGNPHTKEWYELENGSFIVTEDTSIIPSKKYYANTLEIEFTNETFAAMVEVLNENKSYEVRVRAKDNYGWSSPIAFTVPTNYYTIDFLKGGKEISFGTKATGDDIYTQLTAQAIPPYFTNEYYLSSDQSVNDDDIYYTSTANIANPQPIEETWNNGIGYFLQQIDYENQVDKAFDSSKSYYHYTYAQADPQPTSQTWGDGSNWYIWDEDEGAYICQEGEIYDNTLVYFEQVFAYANPQPTSSTWGDGSEWYIQIISYIDQFGKDYDALKTYYTKIYFAVSPTGTENPSELGWYEKESTVYYERDNRGGYDRVENKPLQWEEEYINYYVLSYPAGLFRCDMGLHGNEAVFNSLTLEPGTGYWYHKNTNINPNGTVLKDDEWITVRTFDINHNPITNMSTINDTNNIIKTRLSACRPVNGANKWNNLDICIRPDGTLYTNIPNEVITSNVRANRIYMTKAINTANTSWTGDQWFTPTQAVDNQNIIYGQLSHVAIGSTGMVSTRLYARKYVSGNKKENYFAINVDKNGNYTYTIANSANFRSAIGANNASNLTTGTVASARLPGLIKRITKTSSAFTLTGTTGNNYYKNVTLSFGAQSGYSLVGAVTWGTNHNAALTVDNISTNVTDNQISATVAKRVGDGSLTDVTLSIGALFVRNDVLNFG